MTSENILVTGGAGYIGSHTCKALAKAGYQPIVFDNMISGHREAVRWGPLEIGDILDRVRLDCVIQQYRPTAVVHFAAFAYVGESVVDPAKYYRNNVAGSLSLLDAMRDHGIDRIVFSSTCATYGVPQNLPITEETEQKPINPYGNSKLVVEQMIREFGRAYGLRWIALRYFNAAGADLGGEIGEDHFPETHLIPLVLDAATGRRPDVTVFGTDYDTKDGTCVRDYIHAADLAEAHILALKGLDAGLTSQAFNLGNGNGFSVLEVIEAAKSISGLDIPTVNGPRRAGDPATLICDASKARDLLGWEPKVSDLGKIIQTAWGWHQRKGSHRDLLPETRP
ncbi:UDP-glucose 4-epimerase GalE [Mesorhizobium sp. M0913]|uniref:UDP-glucose 4-epimerase GalE n=1 Tax=Mesorhizobium sp. M0913 TaxID=2957026 RepID=UPI003338CDE4